jgi:multiple sugar transport system permease protein
MIRNSLESINSLVTTNAKKVSTYAEELSTNPIKRKVLMNKVMALVINIIKYIFLVGLCFVIMFPILQQLAIALRSPEDINKPNVVWIPDTFSLMNFKIAAQALNYWSALKNTFFLSFVSALLQVFTCSMVGYAFARVKFKGINLIFIGVILTVIVPPSTISLPNFNNLAVLGLLDKPASMFLLTFLGMGLKSGIFIFLFRQFFKGVPYELEEAAQVDGANAFRVFYQVMLPSARGAIVIVALFAFVWQWNDSYYASLFITSNDFPILTFKLSSLVYSLQGVLQNLGIWSLIGTDIKNNPNFVSMILNTAAIMIMLPLLIMYLFVQKLFVEGVERTGIVG